MMSNLVKTCATEAFLLCGAVPLFITWFNTRVNNTIGMDRKHNDESFVGCRVQMIFEKAGAVAVFFRLRY